jgi:hypothetical protein
VGGCQLDTNILMAGNVAPSSLAAATLDAGPAMASKDDNADYGTAPFLAVAAKLDTHLVTSSDDNDADYGLAPSSVLVAMADADPATSGNYSLVLSSAVAATATETALQPRIKDVGVG